MANQRSESDFAFSQTLDNNRTLARSITNEHGVITNSNINALIASHGIFDSTDSNNDQAWRSKFSRIPYLDPNNSMGITHEYLFFTKPDLHLLNVSRKNTGKLTESLSTYTFFLDAYERYKHLFEQLQQSAPTGYSCPFMNILSNTVRSELEVPSLESENEQETGANGYGTKIIYRGSSYASDQDLNFSLEFEDNKYLEIYMLFKIYDEYCRLKNMGMIELDSRRDDDTKWINYTINKVLHDQFSIYKFITGDDGITIVYWGKYTGVFPVGAPRDAFSSMDGGPQKLTVQFKAQFFRDMDPSILSEFNKVGINSSYKYKKAAELPLFNSTTHRIDGGWSSMPYISTASQLTSRKQKMMKYQLRWKV